MSKILDIAQFSTTDVCNVLGINLKQLEHAIDPNRSIVSLRIHNEQRLQGTRRFFCGEDVLKIGTVFTTNQTGLPQKFSNLLAKEIADRARIKGSDIDFVTDFRIVTWPETSGIWVRASLYNGDTDIASAPVAGIYFLVDRFIDETIDKLEAVILAKSARKFISTLNKEV